MITQSIHSDSIKHIVTTRLLILLCSVGVMQGASAGAYIFAGETFGDDLIAYPSGYSGTGGPIQINVCIVPGSPNAAAMEQSIRNIIAVYNDLLPTTGNLR
ncbi:MAG: hypothetical protein HKO64_09375, partial [Xanthomonadales bacterium]|nr:hypothetical protein [Xanthomonadales bacterium]